jgi:peroxiredoxin
MSSPKISSYAQFAKQYIHLITLFVLLIGGGIAVLIVLPVFAQVASSCGASVSPNIVQANADTTLTFSVTNNTGIGVSEVRFTRPSDNFQILTANVGGWSSSIEDSTVRYHSGSLENSESYNFDITVQGSALADSADWTVQMAGVTCSGSLGVSVQGDPATSISNLTVSDVTATSVLISWSTNNSANSVVEYGTTSGYGSTKTSDSLTTSHSVTIDGLTANTTYHFRVKSTDGNGNTATSSDNTFVAAKASATSTTSTTTTTTTTKTQLITGTPTPTPVPDRAPPYQVITTDFAKPYQSAPSISGTASDVSGVMQVEFSIDEGKNWLPVDISNPGSGRIQFTFKPPLLIDGNYILKTRARDGKGNTGMSQAYTLIIDRLPPQMGSSLIASGPLPVGAFDANALLTVAGVTQQIILASVGGPTQVSLAIDSYDAYKTIASLSAAQGVVSLTKQVGSGLWSGNLQFDKPGLYTIGVSSVDGAENTTDQTLQHVIVAPNGKVIERDTGKPVKDATVTLYFREKVSDVWTVWDGKAFGQVNPQKTDIDGAYKLYVPRGTYYLRIDANNLTSVTSDIFTLAQASPINSVIPMNEKKGIRLGPLTVPFDLLPDRVSVTVRIPETPSLGKSELTGKEAPTFRLPTTTGVLFEPYQLRGQASIISFVNTWSPIAIQQLATLNKVAQSGVRVAAVISQESLPEVTIFQKRAGYTLPIIVDADGTLVKPYKVSSAPIHYVLDRRGVIREVRVGQLTYDQIRSVISRTGQE